MLIFKQTITLQILKGSTLPSVATNFQNSLTQNFQQIT